MAGQILAGCNSQMASTARSTSGRDDTATSRSRTAYLQAIRSFAAALVLPSLLPEDNLQPVRHFSHCKFKHPARSTATEITCRPEGESGQRSGLVQAAGRAAKRTA